MCNDEVLPCACTYPHCPHATKPLWLWPQVLSASYAIGYTLEPVACRRLFLNVPPISLNSFLFGALKTSRGLKNFRYCTFVLQKIRRSENVLLLQDDLIKLSQVEM